MMMGRHRRRAGGHFAGCSAGILDHGDTAERPFTCGEPAIDRCGPASIA